MNARISGWKDGGKQDIIYSLKEAFPHITDEFQSKDVPLQWKNMAVTILIKHLVLASVIVVQPDIMCLLM